MAGIRVGNIPATLSVQNLQSYFESVIDSRIDKIYYPLLNNDAVIIYQDKLALAKILSTNELAHGAVRFDVKPLPHQVFGTTTVLVEDHVTCLILATDEYKDFLQNGVEILSTKSDELALRGNWYELEWAWNYLHRILDHQYHIQEHLVHLYVTSNPATLTTPETRRQERDPESANEANVSSYTRNQMSVADHVARNRLGSPRSGNGFSRDVVSSESPFRAPGARGTDCADIVSKMNLNHDLDLESSFRTVSGSGLLSGVGEDISKRNSNLDDQKDGFDFESSSRTLSGLGLGRHNHSDILNNYYGRCHPDSDSETSQRLSTAVGHSFSGDTRARVAEETRDRKTAVRLSRSEDADHTFENFASSRSHDNKELQEYLKTEVSVDSYNILSDSGDHPANSLTSHLAGLHVGDAHTEPHFRSTYDTEIKGNETSSDSRKEIQHSTVFNFTLPNGMKISVYDESIIKAKVESIVNAANSELMNYSGVARAIEKAAGPKMKKECEDYIMTNGKLPVSHVMHTTTVGKLSHLKCIIHTVGPIYIKGRHDSCVQLLTRTFYNCLEYADEKTMVKSLAFPFISTGIFGVPLECCVEAFLDALVLFTSEKGRALHLENIHLLNNDAESVCLVIVMLQQLLEKSFDLLLAEALDKKQTPLNSSASLLLELSSNWKSRDDQNSSTARWSSSRFGMDVNRVGDIPTAEISKHKVRNSPSLRTDDSVNFLDARKNTYTLPAHDAPLHGNHLSTSRMSEKDSRKSTSPEYQRSRSRSGSQHVRTRSLHK
ncbi:uncharacterized protein LOC121383089 [Gigantopelta aegis]|uniref:uncharacterized protein LOC121383089 n=1 Tax=Gigantopelta aegis TaxID=1735272 RepID=UPI001B887F62|nr:uncharacterized protein LOC121383089 [Gigantopelta aegis]XP_041368799.1 uncharacterized protein LOC121383089 [Gigantopelta aegis]